MIWWASQPSRAISERSAIADLAEEVDWLLGVEWRLTQEARLCADFSIEHLGKSIPLTLTFPNFFPEMPPQVRPREDVRLSGHQYGAGGELCLEYRPDNWEPSFTGAMMISSARRLLVGEEPSSGAYARVEDAHRATVAQDVRHASWRFVIPRIAAAVLTELPLHQAFTAEIAEHFIAKHLLAFPHCVADDNVKYWDATAELPEYRKRSGFFLRLKPGLLQYVKPTYEFLEVIVNVLDRDDARASLAASDEELVFIIECEGVFKLVTLMPGAGPRKVYDYETVLAPEEASRLPLEYARLSEASVAIVGCGSVGSKIAASLARAGVGSFVLVDGDLLFPGNVVRNDLDWDSVGLNKPDAVAARIHAIKPAANVTTRRIALGGQESSGATDGALVAIGKCDVVIDATADPQIFNLCGSIARSERRVLVWGEVFGGGIGGIVARLRPDMDPVPHAARRQINDWCSDHGETPPNHSAMQYGLELGEGAAPLIADDADVSIIASHITRFVLDVFVRGKTFFPQSAYVIGLKPGWIFESPFETWPIDLVLEGQWGPQKDENHSEQFEAFSKEFFSSDAASA